MSMLSRRRSSWALRGAAKAGFTLIELIVCMVIISVALGVCVVRVEAGLATARFRRSAYDVAEFLLQHRVAALRSAKPMVVQVDIEKQQLQGDSARFDVPQELALAFDEEQDARPARYTFFPYGLAHGPDVVLTERKTRSQARLALDPLSGLVQVSFPE